MSKYNAPDYSTCGLELPFIMKGNKGRQAVEKLKAGA